MVKTKKAITITLPEKTIKQLDKLKEKKQMNKSVLVQLALEEYARKEERENETPKA